MRSGVFMPFPAEAVDLEASFPSPALSLAMVRATSIEDATAQELGLSNADRHPKKSGRPS
jgi:hypothetical protein